MLDAQKAIQDLLLILKTTDPAAAAIVAFLAIGIVIVFIRVNIYPKRKP